MKAWMIATVFVILSLIAGGSYIHYSAVAEERNRQYTEQLEANKKLKAKFDDVSAQYQTLKATREKQRQSVVTKENRMVDENPNYYAGDCFDADSLQHIRDSQIPR